jgi:hypothetical protein
MATAFGHMMSISQSQLPAAPLPTAAQGGSAMGVLTSSQNCAVSGNLSQTYRNPAATGGGFSMSSTWSQCVFTIDLADLYGVLVTRTGTILERWVSSQRSTSGELRSYDIDQTQTAFSNAYVYSDGASIKKNCTGSKRMVAQNLDTEVKSYTDTYANFSCNITNTPSLASYLSVTSVDSNARLERSYGGYVMGAGRLDVSQNSPFIRLLTLYPTEGQLQLQDSAGSRVLIRARSDSRVDLEFWPVGSTTAAQSTIVTWEALLGR